MKSTIKLGNGEEISYEPAPGGTKITFKTAFMSFSRVLTCQQSSAALFGHEMALEHSDCEAVRADAVNVLHVQGTTATATP